MAIEIRPLIKPKVRLTLGKDAGGQINSITTPEKASAIGGDFQPAQRRVFGVENRAQELEDRQQHAAKQDGDNVRSAPIYRQRSARQMIGVNGRMANSAGRWW